MAGDWIKMRTDLYRDPKVIAIADSLMLPGSQLSRQVSHDCQCDMSVTRNVMRNVTVGALVSVWGIARHQGQRVGADLLLRQATLDVVDAICDIPGFGEAMEEAGWVVETSEGLVMPKFWEEHNKAPTSNAERQRAYRERKKGVTKTLRANCNESNARVEKSREEKRSKEKPPKSPKGDVEIPEDLIPYEEAVKDWLAYKRERGETYKPRGLKGLFTKMRTFGANLPAAVSDSMANNYAGLFASKDNGKPDDDDLSGLFAKMHAEDAEDDERF